MLFNSPVFLFLFLPLTYLAFRCVNVNNQLLKRIILIVASLIFYSWWDYKHGYVLLLILLTFTTWYIGKLTIDNRASNPKTSKYLAFGGILVNLGTLAWFKYSNFFLQSWDQITDQHHQILQIALPLGISFFVFQKIAYLVDCGRGEVVQTSFSRFALFVSFFPQLIAGPICHHKEITPQLGRFDVSQEKTAKGLFLIVIGLAKKVVVADYLAEYANKVYDMPQYAEFMDAWIGTLAYTLQLYFDFSAYSEIAMGIALLFGVVLPINFNSPYKSKNIAEFWQRWHITLGRFLRDYVYIPLGGNKKGLFVTISSGMAVFTLGGLWHGAAWHFVIWGILHGFYLAIYRIWSQTGIELPRPISIFITLLAVIMAWVLFRADNLNSAFYIWKVMLGFDRIILPTGFDLIPLVSNLASEFRQSMYFSGAEIIWLIPLLIGAMTWKNVHELWESIHYGFKFKTAMAITVLISIFSLSNPSQYLYWNF